MNLKVRFKNPVFWLQLFLAIAAPIGAYYGITGADLTTWSALFDVIGNALSNPFVLFTIVIALWNALNDPTTAGVTDSRQAKKYNRPNGVK